MTGFKHVVFDVDGTLADTDNISQRALQDLLFERTGEEEDLKDLTFTRGIPGDEALAQLGIFDKEALARWDELAREHADEVKLFYGVREMLEELRKSGKKMGIVSSRRHDEYEEVITPLGIDEYFENMVLAEDTGRHKPEPDPLLEYLRRAGAKPEETIYVGDTAHDSRAARAAGASFVFAGWGGGVIRRTGELLGSRPLGGSPNCQLCPLVLSDEERC